MWVFDLLLYEREKIFHGFVTSFQEYHFMNKITHFRKNPSVTFLLRNFVCHSFVFICTSVMPGSFTTAQ